MLDGLTFGWRTAILSVAVAQMLLIAVALSRAEANRIANRTLAALLVVLAGIVTPWAIGFAGFYDKWRWLTFAPFAVTLAVPPLLWLYVAALTRGVWPRHAWRHLVPPAAQFAILFVSFLLPGPLKTRWANVAGDAIGIVTTAGTVIGLAAYAYAGLVLLGDYRRSLAEQRSDDARYAARWLSRALGAALILLPIWSVYGIWDAVDPLGYWRLMGLHIVIALFGLYLGIEGWRHATLPFPTIVPDQPHAVAAPTRDWSAQGEAWARTVTEAGWFRDPDLSLATLARRLGSNTTYVSRALNEGLGVNLSTFVNDLRSKAVAHALDAGDRRSLLDLALDAGFASKASFNRAFRARYGVSPGAYRKGSDQQ